MAQVNTNVLFDGQTSFLGGTDSNVRPSLLSPTETAWVVNGTHRGGGVGPRPGFRKVNLEFPDATTQSRFQNNLFQGASTYTPYESPAQLVTAVGGRQFVIDPVNDLTVREITPSTSITHDDPNSPTKEVTTFTQAERWLVIQDGQSNPIIYDGSEKTTRSDSVRRGEIMAYGNGRLWVGRDRGYVAGDLVGATSGTEGEGFRDSVLKFTENSYLSEGGSFTTPVSSGEISAMGFTANLDTTLGEGDLIIFTPTDVYATRVPTDRTTWQYLRYPIQRLVAKRGAVGPRAVASVNGDLYYRSVDGFRSLAYAVRDFGRPGQARLGAELKRIWDFDNTYASRFASAVYFDNRFLCTCYGQKSERGHVFKGLAAMDFDPTGSTRKPSPPVFEGAWTGLSVLQILSGVFDGEERCFVFAENADSEIELWELTKDASQDHDGTSYRDIEWFTETRAFDFSSPLERKQLDRFEVWLRDMQDSSTVNVYFKSDETDTWTLWNTWSEDVKSGIADAHLDSNSQIDILQYAPSYRNRRQVFGPSETFDGGTNPSKPKSVGMTFQFRIQITGHSEIHAMRVFGKQMTEDKHVDPPVSPAVETVEAHCPLGDILTIP